MDIGSKLTLTPVYPKHLYGLLFTVGEYGGQIINGFLARVPLTMGPMHVQTHHLGMSLVSEHITGIDIFTHSQNPDIGSLTCEMKAIMIERDKGSPLYHLPFVPLPDSKSQGTLLPGEIRKMCATLKEWFLQDQTAHR